MSLTIVYSSAKYEREASSLTDADVAVLRWPSFEAGSNPSAWPPTPATVAFRGPRLSDLHYANLAREADMLGVRLLADPSTYAFGTSVTQQVAALREFMPVTMLFSADAAIGEIKDRLDRERIAPPVLIRSEIESAAKYVGIEGCTIRTNDVHEIQRVLDNLRKNVKGFEVLIAKKIMPVAVTNNGKPIEYRSVGMAGRLVAFDWEVSSDLPDPNSVGVDAFAQSVYHQAALAGATGGLVVDVAASGAGFFVVECKNLQYSSIANPAHLFSTLGRSL